MDVPNLDNDEAIAKLVFLIGACLCTPGGTATQVVFKAKRLEELTFEWIADDATGK